MTRVLPVMRYSGDDDAGAMDRQHQQLSAWIAETCAEVAGWVSDETVSGSVNLDERASLGKWLREPQLHEWDTMAVTTQDRVTRDDMHWWRFVGNLIEWGKTLIVLDDPSLDLSTPNGRMIAGIKATQAANYRLDVQRKARNARVSFRQQRRYAGGHWPYGYRAEPRSDGGEGFRLVPDRVTSELAWEAVDRVLAGEGCRGIAQDWTDRGVDTARDHQARTTTVKPGEKRREPKGYRWTGTTLRRVLSSPHLLGYGTYQGEIIRENGLPVQWSDPIIDPETFKQLQQLLSERGEGAVGIRRNRSPLLGVVYCKCGKLMNYLVNNGYEYYRCTSERKDYAQRCEHTRNWPVGFIQDNIASYVESELGPKVVHTREFIPGENHDSEIAALREAIDHLSGNLANLPAGSRAAQNVIEQVSAREAELDRLEALPSTPSEWRYIPTGRTYGDEWYVLDSWEDRGRWLLSAGITLTLSGSPKVPYTYFHQDHNVMERSFPGYDAKQVLADREARTADYRREYGMGE